MFPGFPTRLGKELKDLYVEKLGKGRKFEDIGIDINIVDPFSRKHAVFIGGSILAAAMGEGDWITKKDYDEKGDACLGSSTSL